MPQDLLLNEQRSRPSGHSFDSPPHLSQGASSTENISECQLLGRRMSMKLTCPVPLGELCKETDEESGCYSRGPTYPGSDSISQDELKSTTDASNDYSMEASKDSEANINDLMTMSSEDIKSSDMTDSSIPGFSTTYDNDESSYKESDAAPSPDSMNYQVEDIKFREITEKGTNPPRKNRKRRSLMNRLNHQKSGATYSSTNSDSRLPKAPMNSPNSNSVITDYDASSTRCFSPSIRTRSTVSTTSINQQMFDDHLLNIALKDKLTTTSAVLFLPPRVTESSQLTVLSGSDKSSSYPWQLDNQTSLNMLSSLHRPPCIGGEAINDDTLDTIFAIKTPLVQVNEVVTPPESASFKRFQQKIKEDAKLGYSVSSPEPFTPAEEIQERISNIPSTASEGANSLPDSDAVNSDPFLEKAGRKHRVSKRFPLFKTLQNIKKHFRSGSKGKIYIQKDNEGS